MHGKVLVGHFYNDNRVKIVTRYPASRIDRTMQLVENRSEGKYGEVDCWLYAALEKYPIKNKDVLILGSAEQGYGPWYECICLKYGAFPVTIDYNKIIYEDDRFKFFTPSEAKMDNITVKAAISISSLEHSGLGRYGDPLDADADLKAMQDLKKMIKPGELLYLAVPLGRDKVVFNLHRIYGRIRLPKLLEGWRMIDSFGYEEALLDRDTKDGWEPRNENGDLLHPGYPEYCPVLVLQNG